MVGVRSFLDTPLVPVAEVLVVSASRWSYCATVSTLVPSNFVGEKEEELLLVVLSTELAESPHPLLVLPSGGHLLCALPPLFNNGALCVRRD